jgi:hypothetical protein
MKDKLVCVICGSQWRDFANRCEDCGGLCSWGYAKEEKPLSWTITEKGWFPKPKKETPKKN